jgi:hypothetical protein
VQYFVEVCGFAIADSLRNLRTAALRTDTPKKFADLQWRNEPKNMRICRLLKKLCLPASEEL